MIRFSGVGLTRGLKTLLQGSDLTIHSAERVGLVGRNGVGKSSVLALIAERLAPDSGTIELPREWRVAEVEQELPQTPISATDFVLAGDRALAQAQQQVLQLEQQLVALDLQPTKNSEQADALGLQFALAQQTLYDLGWADAPARAQSLLLGLGFSKHNLTQSIQTFSGGWQMRLQLARTLMASADLLLLDEPTNHLDLDALLWLEQWLSQFRGTLIVISHDSEFLNSTVNVIVHIDGTLLTRYSGNYQQFLRQRTLRLEQHSAAYAQQQAKIAHLAQFITRFKAKATKAKQAQSRVKALARMEMIAPLLAEADFSFEFSHPGQLPNPMLTLRDADLGYQGQAPILRQVQLRIAPGDRIGILGMNGEGKSTLVKSLVGQLPLHVGERSADKHLRIGYCAQQELDVLDAQESAYTHFERLASKVAPTSKPQEWRNFLAQFHFTGDDVLRPVGGFSGGEKVRLILAMVVWQKPNLLVLDEPTNHLDLMTRDALAFALNTFEGAMLLVSHDRSLLRAVCDEFILVGEGQVQPFEGDLTAYQSYVLTKKRAQNSSSSATSSDTRQTSAKSSVVLPDNALAADTTAVKASPPQTAPLSQGARKVLQSQCNKLEREVLRLSAQREGLNAQLNTVDATIDFAALGQSLAQLTQQIETLEAQWLEVLTQLN